MREMNSKSPSTSYDSLNSMLLRSANESLYRQLKQNTSQNHSDLICLENVDLNLVNYLNNELVNSGYPSIQENESSKIHYNRLFENAIDIISRYNRQLAALNRSQDQNYKLDHENEMLVKRQKHLKEVNEASTRELASVEEKCRQALLKSSSSSKAIKDLTEENRKLLSTMDQRDKQYKHERKKLEKENNRLKERVQTLSVGKTKDLPNMELSESIYRGVNGTRGTWNSDGSKKQLELYSELIKDYDRKNKELIIENTDVKNCLSEIYLDLSKFLKDPDFSAQKSPDHTSSFDGLEDQQSDSDRILAEDVIRQPFDSIFKKFNKELKCKLDQIHERLHTKASASPCVLLQDGSMETLNSNNMNSMNNLTISSIDSYSTKNQDTRNEEELMNATFTIDDTDVDKHEVKKTGYFIEKNLSSSSTSSSSASPPSMSLLTEHLEKLHSKSSSQKRFDKPQIEAKTEGKQREQQRYMDETAIKSELNTLKEERKKLAMEKKYFYEQKLKLEGESSSFRKMSKDLIQQQNEFQEEQEKFYQTKLFSSFIDQSHSSKKH